MLPDNIKEEIQHAYKRILGEKQLRARYGQRLMIAEIARTLAAITPSTGETSPDSAAAPAPVCVVEAGTGTGKTLAYVLGTLPLARFLGKKVVLATATVALQEQVTQRDLPDILRHSGLSFSFTLAKGRGRYLCLSRLDQLLRGNASADAMLELFGDAVNDSRNADQHELYQQMLELISAGQWSGDRDEWNGALRDDDWSPVTVESGQCAGPKCSNYSRCFFYKAREQVAKVDVIVANHDLVLVDLALGGGAILPAPEDTIYIFDEAHHLPAKTNQHFSASTRLRATVHWLDPLSKTLSKLANDEKLENKQAIAREISELSVVFLQITEFVGQAILLFEAAFQAMSVKNQESSGAEDAASFELGVVPAELRELSMQLGARFVRLTRGLKEICTQLRRQIEESVTLAARQQAELWFSAIGGAASRSESCERLWQAFAALDMPDSAPSARWITRVQYGETGDLMVSCSPVLAARTLQENLWTRCAGAVLTSATLSSLGNFDVLSMRAGLPAETAYHRIQSPFDYANAASVLIPRLNCDPSDTVAHTAAIVRLLPKLIDLQEATLMLFSSRRQMLDVLDGLGERWRDMILCQDDYQKGQLINYHRQRVDRGETSIIFGLASFAEGVDLPGEYCRHVLIAKIPFSVPNDPIEATLAQWLELQGRNPFMTLAVPEAAFRLVQATGRLLRNESDTGRITIFDERLVSKFYGKTILDSLPPFRREIFPANL
jgi:ATP-dependent DNA helicase DinG